jgi:hypothetical protein
MIFLKTYSLGTEQQITKPKPKHLNNNLQRVCGCSLEMLGKTLSFDRKSREQTRKSSSKLLDGMKPNLFQILCGTLSKLFLLTLSIIQDSRHG